jgi:hypothetical protein
MNNKYYIAIAKEKYDSAYQEVCYLGMYDCFSVAVEQVKNHDKRTYVYGVREFNYYIFLSQVNNTAVLNEDECIYSLTSAMYKQNTEYVNNEFKQYLVS